MPSGRFVRAEHLSKINSGELCVVPWNNSKFLLLAINNNGSTDLFILGETGENFDFENTNRSFDEFENYNPESLAFCLGEDWVIEPSVGHIKNYSNRDDVIGSIMIKPNGMHLCLEVGTEHGKGFRNVDLNSMTVGSIEQVGLIAPAWNLWRSASDMERGAKPLLSKRPAATSQA